MKVKMAAALLTMTMANLSWAEPVRREQAVGNAQRNYAGSDLLTVAV